MKLRALLLPLSALFLSGCAGGLNSDTSNIETRALNMGLANKAQELKVTYLDTYSILLANTSKPLVFFFQPDGEHLSELGYLRWADASLIPYIKYYKVTCAGMVGDSITRRTTSWPSRPTTWASMGRPPPMCFSGCTSWSNPTSTATS